MGKEIHQILSLEPFPPSVYSPPAVLSRLWQTFRHRRRSFALAVVSGVAYFVGFCGYEQFYLSWICLVCILWALDDNTLSGREALAIAWTFGLVTHLGGYTWIIHLLTKFAYLPWPLAALGWFLLAAAQGSILAAWGFCVHRLVTKLKLPVVWVAPVMMAVLEWLYPLLFQSYLSNSQYRQLYFIQTLDLWGPVGLTFIVTLSSSVIYQTLAWRFRGRAALPKLGWAALGVLVGGSLLYGFGAVTSIDDTVAHSDRRVRIGIVQANMGIYEKTKSPQEGLRRHRDGSLEMERQGAQLIIWPESGYYYAIPSHIRNLRSRVMGPIKTPILFGALRTEKADTPGGEDRYYNSALLIDSLGNVRGTYDKNILLAFGEYTPLAETFPFIYELLPNASHFSRGIDTVPIELDGVRYGILICYEDILPGFVRDVMEHEPDVLVNMTNDAWFGDSNEPLIHLALATFRAVEHRRYLVRATNTGISAFVDPAGRIVSETPVFARANLIHDVTPLSGRTIYGRCGEWVGGLCLLLLVFWTRRQIKSKFLRARERAINYSLRRPARS